MHTAALLGDYGVSAALIKIAAPHIKAIRKMFLDNDEQGLASYKFREQGTFRDLANTGIPMDGAPEHEVVFDIKYEIRILMFQGRDWSDAGYDPVARNIIMLYNTKIPWGIMKGIYYSPENENLKERMLLDIDRFDTSIRHEVTHAIRDAQTKHIGKYMERMISDEQVAKEYTTRGHQELDFEIDAVINSFEELRRRIGQKEYDKLDEDGFYRMLPGATIPKRGDTAHRNWMKRLFREGLLPETMRLRETGRTGGMNMEREAKIASKIMADYGDVELYINIFDIFDTDPIFPLTPAAVEMLKDKVLKAALEATRLLKADVIYKLKKDHSLLEDITDLGIKFKK